MELGAPLPMLAPPPVNVTPYGEPNEPEPAYGPWDSGARVYAPVLAPPLDAPMPYDSPGGTLPRMPRGRRGGGTRTAVLPPLAAEPHRAAPYDERGVVSASARATRRGRGGGGAAPRAGALTAALTEPPAMASPLAARLAGEEAPPTSDMALLLAIGVLLLLGLVMVYSASQLAVPGDPSYWFRKQALWAVAGSVALLICARVDYHVWRRLAFPAMLLCLALLVLVLWRGETIYGAQRWLHIGVTFQPSELVKLALTLYAADWLVRKGEEVRSVLYGLLPFGVLVGGVLGLILLENDLGTTIVVALLALAIFYSAGANLLQFLPALGLGPLGAWLLAEGSAFRRARLDAFLHPLPPGCAEAASYQLCQGLIALGSGGVLGRGLGASVQKAGYLPNPFTDSIFAVIGEELGLVGCALVLALFAVVAWRGFRAARLAPDAYGALVAAGLTTWLVAQAGVNIGSVVDAIPFTGVPLPYVSFGGSSLVTSLAAAGILLNISRHAQHRATSSAEDAE